MTDDRAIADDTVARMVRAVRPEWELREATPAERGHSPVYHVAVEAGDGSHEYVLEATPGEDGGSTDDGPSADVDGVATEARLLAVLDEHTSIPVPAVVGAVDRRADLPTPFLLMESVSGTALPFEETRTLPDGVLRRVARRTGEHLGELHALDAVDSFGRVSHDRADRLDGGRPSGDVRRLTVADGTDSWADYLLATVDRELQALAGTRFADLAPRLRPWFGERIDVLDGPFSPVLGRIDHGVHNLLLGPESGDVTAVLDWGFALAVAPGYDLQCVEYVLSGAVLSAAPAVPDRRELVRRALLDGYRSTAGELPAASDRQPAAAAENHALYELLAVVRSANHLAEGLAKVPDGSEAAVAAGLRAELEETLRSDGR